MARNLIEFKGDSQPQDERFDEYVKETERVGRKRNEADLQRLLKGLLRAELKQLVDNFVKANRVNDAQLGPKAKAFLEIFNTKFAKLLGVVFALNKLKFLELLRANSRTAAEANALWSDVSAKYSYFKTHGVMNSDLLRAFVRAFLSDPLVLKEVQFFMMYHFDVVHDFDVSRFMQELEAVEFHSRSQRAADLKSVDEPTQHPGADQRGMVQSEQKQTQSFTGFTQRVSEEGESRRPDSRLNQAVLVSGVSNSKSAKFNDKQSQTLDFGF